MIGTNQLIPFLQMKDASKMFASMEYNFYLKKNEPDKLGRVPVYINLNISGKRKRVSARIKIHPEYWDDKHMTIIDSESSHNEHLLIKQLDGKITNIRIKYRLAELPLTMTAFLDQLWTAPSTVDFISFFFSIIDLQTDLSHNTIEKHKQIFNKLKEFRQEIPFSEIDLLFFEKVRENFNIIHKNAETTVNSNISVIKKYLIKAEKFGVKLSIDLDDVRVGDTGGRIIWLQEHEIEKLFEYYFSSYIPDYLKISLGYFLVDCYTGMRISDVKARTRVEMLEEFVHFSAFKGKHRKNIMLYILPKVREIINAEPRLFTEFKSEVSINRNLKDIAKICGIKKRLYFHVGRHTFATNYILKGGKVENLQILLGHSKITTTMKYVHVANSVAAKSMMVMMN
ncbi:site-specific integrase [Chryseobacterium flavum]|uniref:site-specific integrase n=1 Tax=Chryseobacterium flavum TaxID=415851 RepID=UPI0028AE8343|nr:tyrosine-type recombinase/integrase [Chryseobacterium flavum]